MLCQNIPTELSHLILGWGFVISNDALHENTGTMNVVKVCGRITLRHGYLSKTILGD